MMDKELRILIVEDSPADAELEEYELRKAGLVFTSRIVDTKEAFFKELNDFSPDIILSDYDLPTFDGLAALRIAKEQYPDLPFILVSGKLGEEFAIEKIKEGATDYVLKNNLKRLVPSVKRALQEAEEITERKRLRRELQESEKLYRLLAENTHDMITRHLPDGTYLYVSPACRTLFGYEPEELIGTNAFEQMHPEDVKRIIAITQESARKGVSNVAQYRHLKKDGQYIWVETVGKVIKSKITGDIEDIICVVRDITDRKQAEDSILVIKQDWENIFQAIGHPTIILDAQHTILSVNRATVKAAGAGSAEEIIGRKCYEIFHNAGKPPKGCPLEKMLSSKKFEGSEMEVEAFGGVFLVSCTPVFDKKGNLQKIIHIATDITERKRAEDELRKSEEKTRSIFRVAPTGIGVVRDRILLDVNQRICEMTGYSKEELVGKSARVLYPTQEEFDYVGVEKYRQIAENGTGVLETRWMKKDTSIINVILASTPIDLNDPSKGVTFTALDISERKQAEETIRREKQFTETLLESLPGLFYLYELDIQSPANSRLMRFNRKHSTLTGYTPEELQGMKIKDWFEPEVLKDAVRAIGIISERGEAQANLQLRLKDGSQVPYAFTGRLLSIDHKMYFLGMGIDISDFVRAQEALKESEEKYRLVVENANDAIFIVQNEKIKFPNRQTIVITGYSKDELASAPFSHFLHADDKEMVVNIHRKRLHGQAVPSTYSFRIIKKSGEIAWIEASVVLVTWEGSPAALTFLRDITVQKKLEEQFFHAQKMEAIGTLAGGIAHDFNNLLMGILGCTSLIHMKTDKTQPFYEELKTIERQVESGADLTRRLLGFARGGKYDVMPVNVNDLIIKTSDIFGRTKKEITLHRKLQEDLHNIEADRGQIEQVLLNLYVNAWQAMPLGGELYLESGNTILNEQETRTFNANPGQYVKISVTDTGVGMDSVTQKRIFEPFFTTKGVGTGTGLGLASTYGIIKNHGGLINVYSEKGNGTTFTLYLPASEKEAVDTKPAEDSLLTGDETILVVDDEIVNVELIKALLEKLGYKILTAQNGKKAIALFKEHSNDIKLVILDMIMPEMNGKETLVSLMEIDKKVRVLLSSGYSINGEASKILDMGCKGFIQKPFRVEELSRKIRTVLDCENS